MSNCLKLEEPKMYLSRYFKYIYIVILMPLLVRDFKGGLLNYRD